METKLFRKISEGIKRCNVENMGEWDMYTKFKDQSTPEYQKYVKRFGITERELKFISLEFSTDEEMGVYCAQYIHVLRRLKNKTHISVKDVKSLEEILNDIVFKYSEYLYLKYNIEIECFHSSYIQLNTYRCEWFNILGDVVKSLESEDNSMSVCRERINDTLQEFEDIYIGILKLMYAGK